MNFFYRITKYNPKYRDKNGYYLFQDEWTCYSEIGSTSGTKILTYKEYLETEKKYIDAIILFMACLNIDDLRIKKLERHKSIFKDLKQDPNTNQEMLELFIQVKNNEKISMFEIENLCKLILRNYLWCMLENDQIMFVHFGWDYYMYIGSERECKNAVKEIKASGLFVEDFISPYLED